MQVKFTNRSGVYTFKLKLKFPVEDHSKKMKINLYLSLQNKNTKHLKSSFKNERAIGIMKIYITINVITKVNTCMGELVYK